MDIGVNEGERSKVAGELAKFLADTYTLYMKTHSFHWNVTGPMFKSLHDLFEEQYTELWKATDEIAERIRSLGVYAPTGYSEFAQLSSLSEAKGVPAAKDMIKHLVSDHETVAQSAHKTLKVAAEADDEVTQDMMIRRMETHQQAAWMLRSLIED